MIQHKFNTEHDQRGRFADGNGGSITIHSSHDTKGAAHKAGMAMRRAGKQVFSMSGHDLKKFMPGVPSTLNDNQHHVYSFTTGNGR